MLSFLGIFLVFGLVGADIPEKLDPFLELLFETSECESVVSNSELLVVETRNCKPFVCDFPFQACMRPSGAVTDEKANQCREIPEKCLTAANGGRPLRRSKAPDSSGAPRVSHRPSVSVDPSAADLESEFETDTDEFTTTQRPSARPKPNRPKSQIRGNICEMGIPDGRFCGFQQKFMYNKATGNCEQFWFPGCRTAETNDNLFDNAEQCRMATRKCGALFSSSSSSVPILGSTRSPPLQPLPAVSRSPPAESGFGGNQFGQFMNWAGSALGGNNGNGGVVNPTEYGGGQLGMSGMGVTQPPNLIRLIANTIRDVGGGVQKGGNRGGAPSQSAAVITNLLQQFG